MFKRKCESALALAKTYSLTSLALLIFASFGIAQTSFALRSFIAKIWFVRLAF
jgi:hypothetical protein